MGRGGEQQAKGITRQAKCGTKSSPHRHRAQRRGSGSPGLDAGQRWRGGRLLPWLPVAYLRSPGSPRRGGTPACAVAGAPRRISQAAALVATPPAQAGSGAEVLCRPVPGASWVPAGTEITMQRAEAARRSRAETAGAAPTAGLQPPPPPPPPGAEPNWRWELTCSTAHPSGPGCTHLSSQGSAAPPEHPRKGRQERRRWQPRRWQQRRRQQRQRRRRQRQQQDAELRPRRAPAQPSCPGGPGCGSRGTGRDWAGAGGLGFGCKETHSRWKVGKGSGLGPRAARQEFWPLLPPPGHQTLWLCLDSSLQPTVSNKATCTEDLKAGRPPDVS